jgi:pyruvate, water dikinase
MTARADIAYATPFSEIGISDRPTVGGKGASLGELTGAGITVPPGFVIATAAFERFMGVMDPGGSIRVAIAELNPADLPAVSNVTREIRERIENARLPEDLEHVIRAACASLGSDTPVAVRSSATSEDSSDVSFAGLQDTYLWIRGEYAVLRAVRSCWASLYSTESVTYRLRLKLPESQVSMAVVIQLMVDSECSGVMFTRSPTTGDRSVVTIEGGWGLGSSIVSGEVTPDRFVVSKVTGEICKRNVSQKSLQHVPRRDRGGVESELVPEGRQALPCLDDSQIATLSQLGRRIERHYGCPQDIEWAIARDSALLYILQARPETVWASRERAPVAAPRAKPFDHVFALLSGRDH